MRVEYSKRAIADLRPLHQFRRRKELRVTLAVSRPRGGLWTKNYPDPIFQCGKICLHRDRVNGLNSMIRYSTSYILSC
jgi:hypothetical protein